MKTEKTFALIIITALLLRLFHISGTGFVLVIALSTLSTLNFLGSLYFFADGNFKNQQRGFSAVAGFFFSIASIGILFTLMRWPMAMFYIYISVLPCVFIFIYALIQREQAAENLKRYFRNMQVRSIAYLLLIGVAFLFKYLTNEG